MNSKICDILVRQASEFKLLLSKVSRFEEVLVRKIKQTDEKFASLIGKCGQIFKNVTSEIRHLKSNSSKKDHAIAASKVEVVKFASISQ